MSDEMRLAIGRLRGVSEYADMYPTRPSLLIDEREEVVRFCRDLTLVLDALEKLQRERNVLIGRIEHLEYELDGIGGRG
jgi:hypothetical protein